MAVGRVLSVMITGTGRKSWVQISSRIIWMFRIPNYIAVWKNEIETSLKARLKFPKRKWIDTSLFSNRRPETSLYKKTAKGGVASIQKTKETRILSWVEIKPASKGRNDPASGARIRPHEERGIFLSNKPDINELMRACLEEK